MITTLAILVFVIANVATWDCYRQAIDNSTYVTLFRVHLLFVRFGALFRKDFRRLTVSIVNTQRSRYQALIAASLNLAIATIASFYAFGSSFNGFITATYIFLFLASLIFDPFVAMNIRDNPVPKRSTQRP